MALGCVTSFHLISSITSPLFRRKHQLKRKSFPFWSSVRWEKCQAELIWGKKCISYQVWIKLDFWAKTNCNVSNTLSEYKWETVNYFFSKKMIEQKKDSNENKLTFIIFFKFFCIKSTNIKNIKKYYEKNSHFYVEMFRIVILFLPSILYWIFRVENQSLIWTHLVWTLADKG